MAVIELHLRVVLAYLEPPYSAYEILILGDLPPELTLPEPQLRPSRDEAMEAVATGLSRLFRPGDVIDWEGVRYASVSEALRAVYDLREVWGEFRSGESALVPAEGPTKS